MDKITFSQVRIRLAKVFKRLFTDTFSNIYESNCRKFSENQIQILNKQLSNELRNFTHAIYQSRNSPTNLNHIYASAKPEIICCFYYRYWMTINLLKMSEQYSPNEIFEIEEDEEDMLYQLLFNVVDL